MSEIDKILSEYDSLDGCVLIDWRFQVLDGGEKQLVILFRHDRVDLNTSAGIKLSFEGDIHFAISRSSRNSCDVINYPVEIEKRDGKILLDFDPLAKKTESIRSGFFCEAESVKVEIV